MPQVQNPYARAMRVFWLLIGLGVGAGGIGLLIGGTTGAAVGITGLSVGGLFLILVPLLGWYGKKQVAQIEALLCGEELLAHWEYDPAEWERYTANERARGITSSVRYLGFGFLGSLVLFTAIKLIAGGLNSTEIAIYFAISAALGALLGGVNYVMTLATYKANRESVGGIHIGRTEVYFGNRFYSWRSWSVLRQVTFEAGNPSIVEFVYDTASGEHSTRSEVRVPVPRGREEEAQALVDEHFNAARKQGA